MSNTPSDAELGQLAEECGIGWGAGLGGMNDFLSTFARAVLAKWGAPQPTAAEFALQALIAAGHVSQGLVDKALALPGAPQPVVREPLTEDQRSDIATAAAGFNWTDDYVEAIDYVIDGVERLHSITQQGGS